MVKPYWSAEQGGFIKCPVPDCAHVGIVITKAHCRIAHGMTQEEVQTKYGLPKRVAKLNKKQMKEILCKGEHL